jgi:hypothetical protein
MAEGGSGSDTPEPYQPEEFQEIAQSPGEKDEQAQQSDQTYQGRGDVTEMGTKEVDENSLDFFDTGGEPAPFDQEAARQSLLRQVEEDPSIFLRRKFAHQIRKRINQPEGNEEDW